MFFFCHMLLARVPPRCVSLCQSPEMIFHGHPWLLKVVRPGSPLNEEPRPTLLYNTKHSNTGTQNNTIQNRLFQKKRTFRVAVEKQSVDLWYIREKKFWGIFVLLCILLDLVLPLIHGKVLSHHLFCGWPIWALTQTYEWGQLTPTSQGHTIGCELFKW